MNIIILTFSKVNNYGANLQCYALSKVLTDMGHSVRLLDYQLPQKISKNPIYNIHKRLQKYKFDSFRKKYLPEFTISYTSYGELCKDYPKADCFIVGSDQVWNPNITAKANPLAYFLDFVPDEVRKVSYAASFGIDKKEYFDKYPEVGSLLKRFDYISVRENSGIELCQTLSGLSASLVVDPTILLGEYSTFIDKTNENNLYTFFFNNIEEYYNVAKDISVQTSANPVILAHYKQIKGFKNVYLCGVDEWVNRIANAKFVVTDSFHCTVFSILCHRNFVVFKMPGKSDRVATLLKHLGLEDRLCNGYDDYLHRKEFFLKPIDYTLVNQKIETLRRDSLNFLKNALK